MKRVASIIAVFVLILVLLSCGGKSNRFRLKGRLLHFDKGVFLVYAPDGGFSGVDTITIEGGRFVWERGCDEAETYVMVLPNFSEQPLFVEPGGKVTLEADASRLREMEIKGTKENELMTAFRRQTINKSPPEMRKLAADFIKAHPKTAVARYLLKTFFIENNTPDYAEAMTLIGVIEQAGVGDDNLSLLKEAVSHRNRVLSAKKLPQFTVHDIDGRLVNAAELNNGVTLIYTWASWHYVSQNMLRRLNLLHSEGHSNLKLLGINLDASREECKQILEREAISCRQVCDEKMFESPLMVALALTAVPDNILLVDGKIVARSIEPQNLIDEVKKHLKK